MSIAVQKKLSFHRSGFDYQPFLKTELVPYYLTDLGALFSGDCLHILPAIQDEMIVTVFADPLSI